MKTKLLLTTLFSVILLSCSNNKEYAYNEAMASHYFSVSDEFEGVYKKFSNGGFKTKFEQESSETELSEIANLKKNTAKTLEAVEKQNPSDAAKDFHNITVQYMKMVEDDFTGALEAYVNLACDCPQQKDSLKTILDDVYNRICDTEDKMQTIQLEYMNKVGFNPEPRKDK